MGPAHRFQGAALCTTSLPVTGDAAGLDDSDPALLAAPASLGTQIQVVPGVRVALRAVSPSRPAIVLTLTLLVDLGRHGFKVLRVDTAAIRAEMVDLKAGRDGSMRQGVRVSVRQDANRAGEPGVAARIDVCLPCPAARLLDDLGPEALLS